MQGKLAVWIGFLILGLLPAGMSLELPGWKRSSLADLRGLGSSANLERVGLDKEFAAILATGVSVCGVSAAIAAGGALKGDPKFVLGFVSIGLETSVKELVAVEGGRPAAASPPVRAGPGRRSTPAA